MHEKKPVINRVLYEHPLSFEPPGPVFVNGYPVSRGVTYADNGDVTIRLYSPGTKKICLVDNKTKEETLFKNPEQDIFEIVISWEPSIAGPLAKNILADGQKRVFPELPVAWNGNEIRNCIDVPSPYGDLWSVKNNPHGVVGTEIIYSSVMNDYKRCMVYTPPGYMKENRDYPVLYMLHGGGANELDWFFSGHAAHIFDNLIEEGKMTPFIAVTVLGMVRFPSSGKVVWDAALECMLTEDIIPYIDKNYRTLTDKWNRGICGLSMGSYMTNDIGFRHPELFGYMGSFTATMTHYIDFPNYERPFLALMKEIKGNPEEFANRYRVFFRSTTPLEDHLDYFETDDRIVADAGIDKLSCNYRKLYSADTSKWDSWRLGLYDFAQLIFK